MPARLWYQLLRFTGLLAEAAILTLGFAAAGLLIVVLCSPALRSCVDCSAAGFR